MPEAATSNAVPPLPTVQLMQDFCQSTIINPYMQHSLGLLKDIVVTITPTDIVLPDDGESAGGRCLSTEWL